jgi:Glycosyltransferase family 87
MTLQILKLVRKPLTPRSEAFHLVCFGLLVANIAFLVGALTTKTWILDAAHHPIHTDFTSVYAAGRLVRDGQPAAAYDWALHYAAENAIAAHARSAYLGWHYPPPFLIVAGLLAALPYTAAFIVWIAATLPLYLATIRGIIGARIGWLIAGATPCLLPNIIPGQNGLLTASLVGGALGLLQRRPLLAGCCLGLLTYKPHFGVLFPLVLVAAGEWKAIAAAAATAAVLIVATIALFGVSSWTAFFHWLPLTTQALFDHNQTQWGKFQSLFALVRMLGGDVTLAWTLQLTLTAAAAIALCLMWRSRRIAYEMKAAALATAIPLATPYVYLYDLAVLMVAAAFIIRCALVTGFLAGEVLGLATVTALFLILPFFGVPIGLTAAAILLLLIARRVFNDQASMAATPLPATR